MATRGSQAVSGSDGKPGSAVKSTGSNIKNVFSVFMRNNSAKKKTPKTTGKKGTSIGDEETVGGHGVKKSLLRAFSPGRGGGSSSVTKKSKSRLVEEWQQKGHAPAEGLIPAGGSRAEDHQTQHLAHLHAKGDSLTEEDTSAIRVIVRVRPRQKRAGREERTCVVTVDGNSLQLGEMGFTFDRVVNEAGSQSDVYEIAGRPVVENCMKGFHGCLLAYGQTGSGKTYSMMGVPDEDMPEGDARRGVIQRTFEDMFERLRIEKETKLREEGVEVECSVKATFIEIYNESITDLMNPEAVGLTVRDDRSKSGIYVDGVQEITISSVMDAQRMLTIGMANRRVAETMANERSSRSHSVFTAYISRTFKRKSGPNHVLRSRLHLVDLAGSERQKSSGAAGDRLKEASNINKSLSALGLVIMSLVDVQQGRQRHVPYRDSKLTYLLQDALGGSSKTVLLATVSPYAVNMSETVSTLRFADNAKRIKNKAFVNEEAEGDIDTLKKEILRLKSELQQFKITANNDAECITPLRTFKAVHEPDTDGKAQDGARRALVAALRREEEATSTIELLRSEMTAMEELLEARDAELKRTHMILKLKESRLSRQNSSKLGPALHDAALLEQEIALLREKLERHPEVKRFALENIRLTRQISQIHKESPSDLTTTGISEEEYKELRKEMLEAMSRADKAEEQLGSLQEEVLAAKEALHVTEVKRRSAYTGPKVHMDDIEASNQVTEPDILEKIHALELENDSLRIASHMRDSERLQYEQLCAYAASLEGEIERLSKLKARYREERDDWSDAFSNVLKEVVAGWEIETELTDYVSQLQSSIQNYEHIIVSERQNHTESQAKVVNRVEEALKSAAALRQDIKDKEGYIETLKSKIASISDEKDSMMTEIERKDVLLHEHSAKMESLIHELEEISHSKNEAEALSASLQSKLQQLNKQHDEKFSEFSKKNEKEINSLRAALASAEMDAQLAASQLKDKAKELSIARESEDDLRRTVIHLREELETTKTELEYDLSDARASLSEAQQSLQTVQVHLSRQKEEYARLDQSHEALKNRVDSKIQEAIARERQTLQSRIVSLEEKLRDAEGRVLQATKAAGGAGPLAKEAQLMEVKEKLAEVEESAAFMEKEIGNLRAMVKTKDAEIAKLRNEMAVEVSEAAQQVQELLAAQARAEKAEARLRHHLMQQRRPIE